MPPKRKRATAAAAAAADEPKPAAAKKAPAKTKAKTTRGKKKAAEEEEANGVDDDDSDKPPPAKRVTRAKKTVSMALFDLFLCLIPCRLRRRRRKAAEEPSASKSAPSRSKKAMGASAPATAVQEPSKPAAPRPSTSANSAPVDGAPYDPARAAALFAAHAEDGATIGPEGLEALCTAAGMPMEGVQPLLLAWQLDAKVMGAFSKDEWLRGCHALKMDTATRLRAVAADLEALLFSATPPRLGKQKPAEAYDRTRYSQYAMDRGAAYAQFYGYCFALAKGESRSIELETACAIWSVLLVPKFPMAEAFVEFVTEKKAPKGVNKDLWSMLLEFCQTVDPALSNFDNDGAWPTAIDDFVEWKKSQ